MCFPDDQIVVDQDYEAIEMDFWKRITINSKVERLKNYRIRN